MQKTMTETRPPAGTRTRTRTRTKTKTKTQAQVQAQQEAPKEQKTFEPKSGALIPSQSLWTTQDVQFRIDRALNERLYLVGEVASETKDKSIVFAYSVTSSCAAKVYRVTIAREAFHCTCPDFCFRKKICKHCWFIVFKALRLRRSNAPPTVPQISEGAVHRAEHHNSEMSRFLDMRADLVQPEGYDAVKAQDSDDSDDVFSAFDRAMAEKRAESKKKRSKVVDEKEQIAQQLQQAGLNAKDEARKYIGEDCSVCLEVMDGKAPVVACPSICRKSFHKECLTVWLSQGNKSCPLCRQDII